MRKIITPTGDIYLTVVSSGKSGYELVEELEQNKTPALGPAKAILGRPDFPTKPSGYLYKMRIIHGSRFKDGDRTQERVLEQAREFSCLVPPTDPSPYLRLMITDEDMVKAGLDLVVIMHQPILSILGKGVSGIPTKDRFRMTLDRHSPAGWLGTLAVGIPTQPLPPSCGFAFLAM